MIDGLRLSEVRFAMATPREQASGLLGWLRCVLDDSIEIDGIALRRSLSGEIVVSFPSRTDRQGRRHPVVRPLNDRVRLHLQRQILTALGITEGVAP